MGLARTYRRRASKPTASRSHHKIRTGNGSGFVPGDFSPAFIVIGLVNVLSLWWFVRLDPQEGAQMR